MLPSRAAKSAPDGSGMKTRVIVNLMANKGSAGRRWPSWRRQLEAVLGPLDVAVTDGPGDGTVLARAALADGCRRLIAAGGDGTVNEVLNGMVAPDGGIAPDAVLCPLPLGTANELCRALGHLAAPDGAVRALASGRTRRIDVIQSVFQGFDGRPATRYGYLVASFGGLFAIVIGLALVVPVATQLLMAAAGPLLRRATGVRGAGFIDNVIEPRETRQHLINALEMLQNKRDSLPPKKHGNIPL